MGKLQPLLAAGQLCGPLSGRGLTSIDWTTAAWGLLPGCLPAAGEPELWELKALEAGAGALRLESDPRPVVDFAAPLGSSALGFAHWWCPVRG